MKYQNILVIDDDVDDQEIFNIALEKISGDFKCLAMTNARRALDDLLAKLITPDIIFLDLNMPLMSGEQFLEEVKDHSALQNTPIVILSTSSNPASITLTRNLGASDFITKPNSIDKFVKVLQAVLKNN